VLGLKVSINGGNPWSAVPRTWSVLKAGVNLAGQLGARTQHPRPGEAPDLWLWAAGLTSRPHGQGDEHINWIQHHALKVGDSVTIEIVRIETPSEPVDRTPARRRA
jgi:hypothetical protein